MKCRYEWDLGGDFREVVTESGERFWCSKYKEHWGWIPHKFWPFRFKPDGGTFIAPNAPFSYDSYWFGEVDIPEEEIDLARAIINYVWMNGPMPDGVDADQLEYWRELAHKCCRYWPMSPLPVPGGA